MANTFSGLANPSRVAIFRQLLKRHPLPMLFGQISKCCAIPPSTLKHHLGEMEQAGIVSSNQVGRSTELHMKTSHLENMLRQLLSECCRDEDGCNNNQAIGPKTEKDDPCQPEN